MESDVRWHHGQTLATGQVAEFKVWAELVRQSFGRLHVFLPLRDVGIDGVLHRVDDGAYFALQVKARTNLTPAGQVHITVTASSLVDDDALIIAALIDGAELGPMLLVISESNFRRLAAHEEVEGREYLTAAFELHEGGYSRWSPYLVARERLAERFGVLEGLAPEAVGVDRMEEGFIGEAEVIRRLAEVEALGLFRPFPDLETVELLARHRVSGRYLGLQVKTSGWDQEHREERIYFRRSSFRPGDSTFVCVVGWNRDSRVMADQCLLIPTVDIPGLARVEGDWLVLELSPGGAHHRRLDIFRVELKSLGSVVESELAKRASS